MDEVNRSTEKRKTYSEDDAAADRDDGKDSLLDHRCHGGIDCASGRRLFDHLGRPA